MKSHLVWMTVAFVGVMINLCLGLLFGFNPGNILGLAGFGLAGFCQLVALTYHDG